MWMGGSPAGFCDKPAWGEQFPREVLAARDSRYLFGRPAYCHGPCCPDHGGPKADEPRVYQDGYTPEGRPMWCAVNPDFINLQESPAGFSGNPLEALRLLAMGGQDGR